MANEMTDEQKNRKLHEWLFPNVPWKRDGQKIWEGDNPKYYIESGFFALLRGLRSKGFDLSIENDADVWWVHIPDGDNCKHGKTYSASGDTLNRAAFEAAVKAMDIQEQKP